MSSWAVPGRAGASLGWDIPGSAPNPAVLGCKNPKSWLWLCQGTALGLWSRELWVPPILPSASSWPCGLSLASDTAPSPALGSPAPQEPPRRESKCWGLQHLPGNGTTSHSMPGFLVPHPARIPGVTSCQDSRCHLSGVLGTGMVQVALAGLGCGHCSSFHPGGAARAAPGAGFAACLSSCGSPPQFRAAQIPKLSFGLSLGCKSALSQAQDGSGGGRRGGGHLPAPA